MAKDRNNSRLFTLLAIVITIAALYFAKEILLPLALAILLSFLLTPLANRLERWGVPRIPTVMLVVGMAFVVLGVLGWVVTLQLVELSRELPNHKDNLIAKIESIRPDSQTITKVTETIEDVRKEVADGDETVNRADEDTDAAPVELGAPSEPEAVEQTTGDQGSPQGLATTGEEPRPSVEQEAVEVKVIEMPPSPLTQVQSWLGPLVAPITAAGLVIVMVFFILMDRENQRNRLIQLFGRSNLLRTTEAIRDAGVRIGRYLRMLFLINAGYGVAVAIALSLIGVPSAILWGVLGFSLRFLPYIGPWIAAVLPILVSVATSDGWMQPLLVVGMYVIYELLLNNVAEPMLYGSSIGVSTVGVILSAIFWTWIWGPIGLVLAMPLTVCLVVLARYVPQLRFLTVLLADQPPLTPSERIYQRLLAFDYNEPLTVARTHLKSASLASFYDEVLIPALVLAEHDRHAGLLTEEQEEFVHEATGDLIDELSDAAATSDAADEEASTIRTSEADLESDAETPKGRVHCIPLRDEADEAAAHMLVQLLEKEGFDVEAEGAESLTSEMVDRVAQTASDLVVISILPPIAPRDTRLLWKRLRSRYPDLPIIVGYWNAGRLQEMVVPPENDGATKVATSLAEALALVRNTAVQIRLAKDQPHATPIRDAAG